MTVSCSGSKTAAERSLLPPFPPSLFLLPSPSSCFSFFPPSVLLAGEDSCERHGCGQTLRPGVTRWLSGGFQETGAALRRFRKSCLHRLSTQGKSLGGGGWHCLPSDGDREDLCPSSRAAFNPLYLHSKSARPHPRELATAAGTRPAGGQGKPGHGSHRRGAGLRNVSQPETRPKTRAVKLQGKPLVSSQKEIGYAKVLFWVCVVGFW